MTQLLDRLELPNDLKTLSTEELTLLSSELRERLIDVCQTCGGHLASNLGVVELSVVLHTLFDSPADKFVWDTSHQTYVHKMLTGRLNQMHTIRQKEGLSGFAKISESAHDCFGAGHASTALSAAVGMAHARDRLKEPHSVVSIIGDASLSGGMCFEALNNLDHLSGNFICILNDNNMAISKPVGQMAAYMTRIRTSSLYDQAKEQFEKLMTKIPHIGEPLRRRIEKAVDHFRDIILDTKAGVIFEEFGFKYLGPIDGHDIPTVMAALKYAKQYPKPILVHIITQKGKGLPEAEEDPIYYHGVAPKKAPTSPASDQPKPKTYSQTFGDHMSHICDTDPSVMVITPAMTEGSGLVSFSKRHPDQFIDVGIAEEHAVTYAAGLAQSGIKPVLSIYSTFLQRGYDQLIHDVCLQNLPVIFALDRSGFAGEDGATHHGVFDMAFMLPIPNLQILAPKDGVELNWMLDYALQAKSPISIRFPKGPVQDRASSSRPTTFDLNAERLVDSEADQLDVLLIGIGSMAWVCADAASVLSGLNITCSVVNLRSIKPLDHAGLSPLISKSRHVIVIEEGVGIGGVFSYLRSEFNSEARPSWHSMAIADQFFHQASVSELREQAGLTANAIIQKVQSLSFQPLKMGEVNTPAS